MPLRSTRLTTPLTSVPTRSLYASTTCARSASRTFCTMTCFACWAAMRPKATDSIGCSTKPPTSAFGSTSTRVLEAQLALRNLELLRVVGEHLPAAEGLVVAALAVDGDARRPFLAVALAGSGRQRGFERLEDDFLVDALLVRDGIHDHQDFLVHVALPPCKPAAQAAP